MTIREDKLRVLHGLNGEYKAIVGDPAYLYATAPGEGTEYFVFSGPLPEHDKKVSGIDNAIMLMRQRLDEAKANAAKE